MRQLQRVYVRMVPDRPAYVSRLIKSKDGFVKQYTQISNSRWRTLTLIVEPYVEFYYVKKNETVDVFVDDDDDISKFSIDVGKRNHVTLFVLDQVYVFKNGERVEPAFG